MVPMGNLYSIPATFSCIELGFLAISRARTGHHSQKPQYPAQDISGQKPQQLVKTAGNGPFRLQRALILKEASDVYANCSVWNGTLVAPSILIRCFVLGY